MLLRTEPFVFNGTTILITEQNDTRRSQLQVQPTASTSTLNATTVQPPTNGATALSTSTSDTAPAPPTSSLAFAPRARKRKAIGKGRTAPLDKTIQTTLPVFVPSSSSSQGDQVEKGQDDFRALVNAKNKQREGRLIAKISGGAETETGTGTDTENGTGEKRGLDRGAGEGEGQGEGEEREVKKARIDEE